MTCVKTSWTISFASLSKHGSILCIKPSSIVIRVSSACRVLGEISLDGFFKTVPLTISAPKRVFIFSPGRDILK